jgi:hypothetical protein
MDSEVSNSEAAILGSATYEVIRKRLESQAEALGGAADDLDKRRQQAFGEVRYELIGSERIVTAHSCVPADMVMISDDTFLFGFNVKLGLKREASVGDVFSVYKLEPASGTFKESDIGLISNDQFNTDFRRLYHVYEKTEFRKFTLVQDKLFMKFSTGASNGDIAVFKWVLGDNKPIFADGRAEAEYRRIAYPPTHPFSWRKPARNAYRYGDFAHVSIDDLVFISCTGGNLIVKIEDNTDTGAGIYSEPVADPNQKVDDAEVFYGRVGQLLVFKVRPYKEKGERCFVFNPKLGELVRADGVIASCAELPNEHGLVFSNGYYLSTGLLRIFDRGSADMVLERVVESPRGEDVLYVFYNRSRGEYALLPYRLVSQKIDELILCHGFTLFPNGHLVVLRADDIPQKHHLVQIRITPFYQSGYEPEGGEKGFLHKVGNKDVVRFLSDCNEILLLVSKGDLYSEVYADILKRCEVMLDAYPWLGEGKENAIVDALGELKRVAGVAVEEFDKVLREKTQARDVLANFQKRVRESVRLIRSSDFRLLSEYAEKLGTLKGLRAEGEGLRSTRYIDLAELGKLEEELLAEFETLSQKCSNFLLGNNVFDPYRTALAVLETKIEGAQKVAEVKSADGDISEMTKQIEVLIEMVNGLSIGDAVDNTKVLSEITEIYAKLNQCKSDADGKRNKLATIETGAKFSAQIKLLGQSVGGYLSLSDTAEKCDENLNKLLVQLEDMEGAFSDVDEHLLQISQKRAEVQEAFEQRKVFLTEQRSKKIETLTQSGERIILTIKGRLDKLSDSKEIDSYVLTDALPRKVRDIAQEIRLSGDAGGAEELLSLLKKTQQAAASQLKDRAELASLDGSTIRLGEGNFSVNKQPLEVTVISRDGVPHIHVTGTQFYEELGDQRLEATRAVWSQTLISETDSLYRAEYLAWAAAEGNLFSEPDQAGEVISKMAEERFQEGYVKGIHDEDAIKIGKAVKLVQLEAGLTIFDPDARAAALLFWTVFLGEDEKRVWEDSLRGIGRRNKAFGGDEVPHRYTERLSVPISEFCVQTGFFGSEVAARAAKYLARQVSSEEEVRVSEEGWKIANEFVGYLDKERLKPGFAEQRGRLAQHPRHEYEFVRDFIASFLKNGSQGGGEDFRSARFLNEAAVIVFAEKLKTWKAANSRLVFRVEGMRGKHPLIKDGIYQFDYIDLQKRIEEHRSQNVPLFLEYQSIKSRAVEEAKREFKLNEFKPNILPTFVRNLLIDKVYLPLIGANLAKQIGTAGEDKRTDLMGLMLVLSPPGYGKTTLIEYVAARLGMAFIKINGPVLGRKAVSLDPQEAPDGAAAGEIRKLNLAFEMGNNVMICVDDIQHCAPEFLQKFISLCDAQRKIEGVWKGKGKTYDLKGKRVAVVMAGNPYTESGEKFRIPDMLANRADVYNLGDVAAGDESVFRSSYLENSATSNPVLRPVMEKNPRDLRVFLKMIESGGGFVVDGLEGGYSAQESDDIISTLRKLSAVRDAVFRVNQRYIASANQSEEFREEPPFKLQGSYRDMNKLAARVVPVMNDNEVKDLIVDHYRRESQTLATNAEANFLSLKNILGWLNEDERLRWDEICRTYRKNASIRSLDGNNDPATKVVAQLASVQSELSGIGESLRELSVRGGAEGGSVPLAIESSQLQWFADKLDSSIRSLVGVAERGEIPKKITNDLEKRVVEFELTHEMLEDERKLLEHFRKLAKELREREGGGDKIPFEDVTKDQLELEAASGEGRGVGGGGTRNAKGLRRGKYLNISKAIKLPVSHVDDRVEYLTGSFHLKSIVDGRAALVPLGGEGALVLVENPSSLPSQNIGGTLEFTMRNPLRITGVANNEGSVVKIFAESTGES